MNMAKGLLDYAKRFHGHLGPFLVIGLRMGSLAKERLGNPDPVHSLEAMVELENKRPISCLIDGIQVSSGCTLGKGNIMVTEGRGVWALFRSGGRKLKISLREEIRSRGLETPGEEDVKMIIEKSDEALFEVEYAES